MWTSTELEVHSGSASNFRRREMSSPVDQSQPLVVYFSRKLRSKLPQRKRCRWQLSPPLPSPSLSSTVSSGISPELSTRKESINDAKKLRTTEPHSKTSESAPEASEMTVISESSFSWCASSSGAATKRQEEIISDHMTVGGENGANSELVARSEVTSVQQHSPTKSGEFSSKLAQKIPENVEENRKNSVVFKEDDVVSVTSAVGFCHEIDAASSFAELRDETTKLKENRASEFESSFKAVSTIDADLTCTEQLTYDDVPDYSSGYEESFSDLQSETFPDSCDYEFSSSPYLSFDSGSQFSERSAEDSAPSHTFALLLQFRKQFSRSSNRAFPAGRTTSTIIDEDEVMNFGFDDEEDAVSYQMLRNRERKRVILWNYDEQYSECIIGQRSRMVHWMIEQCRLKRLQKETLFLAVSIFDRFLRVGSFKSRRNFQIAGIASLTLATRIEENQPYNGVRQMVFSVGSDVYRRCEVVAMEWLVQEALCFQCSSVTVHNFLWFYLKAARANNQLNKVVKDLAEVALLDHELLCFWPSTVAASLVIMAYPEDAAAQRVIETHVRTQDDDLTKCIESFQWLIKYIC